MSFPKTLKLLPSVYVFIEPGIVLCLQRQMSCHLVSLPQGLFLYNAAQSHREEVPASVLEQLTLPLAYRCESAFQLLLFVFVQLFIFAVSSTPLFTTCAKQLLLFQQAGSTVTSFFLGMSWLSLAFAFLQKFQNQTVKLKNKMK